MYEVKIIILSKNEAASRYSGAQQDTLFRNRILYSEKGINVHEDNKIASSSQFKKQIVIMLKLNGDPINHKLFQVYYEKGWI